MAAMTALYVVFRVADSEYVVSAAQVLQLESYTSATAIPGAAPHVLGIVQVRGRIVPVIDLRLLFGQPPIEVGIDSRIIVVEVGPRTVGLRVDLSREVLRLDVEQFQPTPLVITEQSRGFVLGVARVGSRLFMLFDLDKALGEDSANDHSVHTLEGDHGRPALPG
jgi:purine-binding chemotaxis protein CheW